MTDTPVDMTPPEGDITEAVCDWPTEPRDATHPEAPALALALAPAIIRLADLRRAFAARMAAAPFTLVGTTQYVRRGEWGARAPRGRYEKLRAGCMVSFHWEGPTMGGFAHDKCAGKIRTIQNYHMDRQGWTDIAYSAVVCPHRFIFEGRGYWNRTAANGTNAGNDTSYAICYLGGVGDPFTEGAKMAFLDALLLFRQHGGASNETRTHDMWRATACPGDSIRQWERAGCPPPPGYTTMPDPTAPQPPPNGGDVLPYRLPDTIGFIDHPHNDGGWLVTKKGAIFTKAPAQFFGSLGNLTLNAPIAAFLPTPSGNGYWLFGEDGGVFTFGDAPFNGAYQPFADEYRAGIHKVAGAYFRGNRDDRSTWRYSYVSDKLESYDI